MTRKPPNIIPPPAPIYYMKKKENVQGGTPDSPLIGGGVIDFSGIRGDARGLIDTIYRENLFNQENWKQLDLF